MTNGTTSSPEQVLMPDVALLATMPPLPHESCASWIQRMGGDHQYSMHKLMQILGVRASNRDWDLPIALVPWLRILAVSGVDQPEYGYSLRVLSVLTTSLEPSKLLLHSAGRPRYRWCARCLASDPIPYLRWHWRLRLVENCEVHRMALCQVCPWCLAPLWTDSCRLVALGAHGLASDLAHCDRCGMPLRDEREQPHERVSRVERRIRKSLKSFEVAWDDPVAYSLAEEVPRFVQAAGLQSAVRRRVPARLGFGSDVVVSRWMTGTPFGVGAAYARASANAARLDIARDEAKRWTLNALSFNAAPIKATGSNALEVHWSWRLGGDQRLEVARALRTIRQDRRRSADQERAE
ncbi:hypothetical protein J2W27_004047 [Variovorax boronicumulans]|uniref:TniQ family protein n=1 Tax=Variovorax boronicumulans TaxID=436515 RepID=UPI0027877D9A|nr:TniQ family protein [Variovorax boronicumulans]MDP9911923.1 hypothetical protein [Variovorax boronicumulans]